MSAARLKYRVVKCSSEDPEFPVSELLTHSSQTKGWQTARFCDFPQEIGLQFETPVHLRQAGLRLMVCAGQKPFMEEVVPFCPEHFNFGAQILRLLHVPGEKESAKGARDLSQLHVEFPQQRPRLRSPLWSERTDPAGSGRTIFSPSSTHASSPWIEAEAFSVGLSLRTVSKPDLEEEMLIFEHCPNLRIHLSGERINWWVPLTPCSGSASLWAESAPGLGDFHAFEVQPGEAVRFYGQLRREVVKAVKAVKRVGGAEGSVVTTAGCDRRCTPRRCIDESFKHW
eukprot:g27269.t2